MLAVVSLVAFHARPVTRHRRIDLVRMARDAPDRIQPEVEDDYSRSRGFVITNKVLGLVSKWW